MGLLNWDGCRAGPGAPLLPGGVLAGLVSEVAFQKHLPDTPELGVCLATQKHFSTLPSLKAALIRSFSPSHPIYSSLVLARAERNGESVTLQAPIPLVTRL